LPRWKRRRLKAPRAGRKWNQSEGRWQVRQLRIPALIALLSVLLLTGCAQPKLAVPASLLQCQAQPGLELTMDDHAVARWMLDTVDAGEDCRAKLRLVRGLVQS
jgi:hypothetical protein